MTEIVSYAYNAPIISGFPGTLTRAPDGAVIPCDLGNMDYQRFLSWVAESNEPPEGWTGPTNPPEAA